MSKRAKAKLVETEAFGRIDEASRASTPQLSGRQEPTSVTEQGGFCGRLAVTLLGKVLAPPYGKLLLGG